MGLPGSRPRVWCSSGDDDLLLRCWLAGLGPGCRPAAWAGITQPMRLTPLAGWATTRCCTAGRCAPGLLAGGGYPVPARRASGPANQPTGIVAAVELTSYTMPGRRERGAGIRGRRHDGRRSL